MAETTIEWTATRQPDGTLKAGYTFNPWIGCSKVHEGCRHCYAERDFDLRRHKAKWGPSGTRVLTSEDNWEKPFRWNKAAEKAGVRAKVFCASLADVFEDWRGPMTCHKTGEELAVNANGHVWPTGWPSFGDGDDWGIRPFTVNDARRRLFDMIDSTPWLDWLLLTKRPENVVPMWVPRGSPHVGAQLAPDVVNPNRRQNVWLLTSISDQQTADKQIPELLKCRDLCPVLGVSAEPLLGPVDLHRRVLMDDGRTVNFIDPLTGKYIFDGRDQHGGRRIDWVIVGGESGPHARPMHPEWARSLRDQCQAAGVPFFMKQWGEWLPIDEAGPWCEGSQTADLWPGDGPDSRTLPTLMFRVGKHAAGRVLDGRTWDEMPITSEVT